MKPDRINQLTPFIGAHFKQLTHSHAASWPCMFLWPQRPHAVQFSLSLSLSDCSHMVTQSWPQASGRSRSWPQFMNMTLARCAAFVERGSERPPAINCELPQIDVQLKNCRTNWPTPVANVGQVNGNRMSPSGAAARQRGSGAMTFVTLWAK